MMESEKLAEALYNQHYGYPFCEHWTTLRYKHRERWRRTAEWILANKEIAAHFSEQLDKELAARVDAKLSNL